MKQNNLIKKTALAGILSAQAAALSFLEGLIPLPAGFPPGAKPGFSNIVVMFSAATLGVPYTASIVLIKAMFAGITRGITAFFMSLAGGILSACAGYILLNIKKHIKLGYIGIGIICAVCHNTGQLCVACVISGTPELFAGYGPFLLIAAMVTGFLTGTILKYIMPVLEKQTRFILRDKGLNK